MLIVQMQDAARFEKRKAIRTVGTKNGKRKAHSFDSLDPNDGHHTGFKRGDQK